MNAIVQLVCESTQKAKAVMRAIPTEAPMRCPVCIIPPEEPAYFRGTSASVSDWLGLITVPWPIPTNVKVRISHHSLMCPPARNHATAILELTPIRTEYIPPITTIRPYLGTFRPPQRAANVEARALGIPTAPAAMAL